jgi:hypothetical protein
MKNYLLSCTSKIPAKNENKQVLAEIERTSLRNTVVMRVFSVMAYFGKHCRRATSGHLQHNNCHAAFVISMEKTVDANQYSLNKTNREKNILN